MLADTYSHYPTSFTSILGPFGPRTHFFDGKLEA